MLYSVWLATGANAKAAEDDLKKSKPVVYINNSASVGTI